MSRIGEEPIKIKEGVDIIVSGQKIVVKGPKGELGVSLPEGLSAEVKDLKVQVSRKDNEKSTRSMQGTYRMLVSNAVKGVKEGYEKKLELVGVGYRARMEGTTLVLTVGWNHPVRLEVPENLEAEVPSETEITVKGIDKQLVGEFAAKIRGVRKPEPYKGKGIRYEGEYIKIKTPKVVATAVS